MPQDGTGSADFPFKPGVIDYLKRATRYRDLNTRPRVRYYIFNEDSPQVLDPMTDEVVNIAQAFENPRDIPAKVEVRAPGGSFVTPEGPFKRENRVTFIVGVQTLTDEGFSPKPRDEFEINAIRFRIKAFDKEMFLQNNQASLDLRYTCEFVERFEGSDLTDSPNIPGGTNEDLPQSPTVEVASDV